MTDADSQLDPHPTGGVVPAEAMPALVALRQSLERYRTRPAADELDRAFAAGTALMAAIATPAADRRPDLAEVRRVAEEVPDFGRLLSVAADAAAGAAHASVRQLWAALGLQSAPPTWTAAERDAARMVFGCACALAQNADTVQLRRGLRGLAASRFAERLTSELAQSEDAWTTVLGDRYESVRHRCAPRTPWRSRGLSELIRVDDVCRRAMVTRLERWLAAGGGTTDLGAELEAALVHARTPPKFA